MGDSTPRVCVVGAGVVGLATAFALVERGAEVTCFEGSFPGAGQSGGLTRVFRHVHATAERVTLAAAARQRWLAWEERFGRRLIGREGVVLTGDDVEQVASLFTAAGVPFSLGNGTLSSALPIAQSDSAVHLLDETAGAIRAARSLRCLTEAIGESYRRATVFGLSADGGPIVETSDGVWRGDHVVVCAGAQTTAFASAFGVEVPEARELHPQAYFRVRSEFSGRELPCLLERSGAYDETVYASPVGSTGLYAVGLSSSDNAVGLGPRTSVTDASTKLADLRDRTIAYVRDALPGLIPKPERVRTCVVTRIADDDALGAWQHGDVTFFAGHNAFKFAPLLGELLADAAISGAVPPVLRTESDV